MAQEKSGQQDRIQSHEVAVELSAEEMAEVSGGATCTWKPTYKTYGDRVDMELECKF